MNGRDHSSEMQCVASFGKIDVIVVLRSHSFPDSISSTQIPVSLRDLDLRKLIRVGKKLHKQPCLGVPRYMAMKCPLSRIVRDDAQQDPAVSLHRGSVSAKWVGEVDGIV